MGSAERVILAAAFTTSAAVIGSKDEGGIMGIGWQHLQARHSVDTLGVSFAFGKEYATDKVDSRCSPAASMSVAFRMSPVRLLCCKLKLQMSELGPMARVPRETLHMVLARSIELCQLCVSVEVSCIGVDELPIRGIINILQDPFLSKRIDV